MNQLLAQTTTTAICSSFYFILFYSVSPAHPLNFTPFAKLLPYAWFRNKTHYYSSVFTLKTQYNNIDFWFIFSYIFRSRWCKNRERPERMRWYNYSNGCIQVPPCLRRTPRFIQNSCFSCWLCTASFSVFIINYGNILLGGQAGEGQEELRANLLWSLGASGRMSCKLRH